MTIKYANGTQESRLTRLQRILPLLVCPRCRGTLTHLELNLDCLNCGAQHPVKGGVPILLPEGVQDAGAMGLSEEDRVSRHPYSERAEQIISTHETGWVLDLGAGGKLERRENVIQIDIFRYPAVDVVGSADCLPFGDNSFDAIISQAVFEHLQYPEWAVAEIRRVLKPGGIAKIDTAFLQPEHGYPHHFYNATETGLLHWFRDFDIEWSGVEPFQHPKWAMHWFLGLYLDYIGQENASVLRQLTMGDLVDALKRLADGQTTLDDLKITKALDGIPIHFQRVIAAGVSVHAINPAKHEVALITESAVSPLSLDREREMAQLRVGKAVLIKNSAELQERLKVAQDKADYLVQFYPGASHLVSFATTWAHPQNLEPHEAVANARATSKLARPFATLVVYPNAITCLLDTFLSLTNQSYSGWELILVTKRDIPAGVMRAVIALCQLDQRVVAVSDEHISIDGSMPNGTFIQGEYWIRLPEGATLAFNALDEVVTLARNLPGISRIGFDFDRSKSGTNQSMRCHTHVPFDTNSGVLHAGGFESNFLRSAGDDQLTSQWGAKRAHNEAHIPLSLVHLDSSLQDENAPLKASLAYLLEQNREMSTALRQGVLKNIMQMGLLRWARRHVAKMLRKCLPPVIWTRVFKWTLDFNNRNRELSPVNEFKPFVSFVLDPETADSLSRTIFSLVQQNYSGWELLLIDADVQSPDLRRALNKFSNFDKRVVVVVVDSSTKRGNRKQLVQTKARGDYILELVDGVTLSVNALEEVVTLAQARPGTDCIVCDFDVVRNHGHAPMRCYNICPAEFYPVTVHQGLFNAIFILATSDLFKLKSTLRLNSTAHIPLCLFHFSKKGLLG